MTELARIYPRTKVNDKKEKEKKRKTSESLKPRFLSTSPLVKYSPPLFVGLTGWSDFCISVISILCVSQCIFFFDVIWYISESEMISFEFYQKIEIRSNSLLNSRVLKIVDYSASICRPLMHELVHHIWLISLICDRNYCLHLVKIFVLWI
jgi:hypothetical protein